MFKEGPVRRFLEGFRKRSPELPRTWEMRRDLAQIDRFITDETSDAKEYNEVAMPYTGITFTNPEAKALAAQLALEEERHATMWKVLKAKLERETER